MKNGRFILSNKGTVIDVPASILRQIRNDLSLKNPAFTEALKHGRWTGNLDEWLRFYDLVKGGISFPRGYARQAWGLCLKHGLRPDFVDKRRQLEPVSLSFCGDLRGYQQQAVDAVMARDDGVLEASTGSGKTVVALAVIAARKQPTLILVHTKELLQQWQERIKAFLEIMPGQVGAGKLNVQFITVGMVQTVRKHLNTLPEHFGQLVIDECHRTPSNTFSECVQAFDCRFLLGLSATPFRRDGLGKLIDWTLGDLVHKVDPAMLRENGSVLKPEVITRETGFQYPYDDDYTTMISELTQDQDRNQLIAQDITRYTNGSGAALVVSDRVAHLEALAVLTGMKAQAILTGQTPAKEREKIVNDLAAGNVRVLFSTVQLIGEGFDAPGLCDLHLATPIKFKGRLIQVVGRVLRPRDGKQPRIFDYQDMKQPILRSQAKARIKAYKELMA